MTLLKVHLVIMVFLLTGAISSAWSSEIMQVDDEASRLIYRADKTDEAINNSGQVYLDARLAKYLQAIMDKLYPEYKNVFRIQIYISTDVNAFVLPNGSVYVNIGLLAKSENEAQVAAILAHEGAHYVHNHQLLAQQNLKSIASGADVFGLERSLSYLSDYSIEIELEADKVGFDRLLIAQYDPKEAVKIFRTMAEEAALYDIKERSVYGTHPKLMERIKYFTQLSRGRTGYIGKDTYIKLTEELRVKDYEYNLSKYRYQSILHSLVEKSRFADAPPKAWFYLGEAYRQRGGANDAENAENAYLRAIELVPQFAPSYAALGVLYMKSSNYVKAREYFARYMTLSPEGQQSGYIRHYYRRVKNGQPLR